MIKNFLLGKNLFYPLPFDLCKMSGVSDLGVIGLMKTLSHQHQSTLNIPTWVRGYPFIIIEHYWNKKLEADKITIYSKHVTKIILRRVWG